MNRSEAQAPGNPASQPVPLDLNKLVDQFVQLRDRKRELKKLHKEQLKPYNKLLDEIGNQLLAYMQQAGLNATPTESGTAYQITKQSATIRDGAAFRAFVIEGEEFDLVDWRANAAAVFDYIAENDGQMPPGINASTFTSIGVRRPNEKEYTMNQPLVPQQGNRNLAQLIANLGPQSKILETSKVDPRSLAAGIKPSFASITFKGKTWGIRYRGVTQQLLARDQSGQVLGAIPTIDVVIIKSAMAISKTFYIEKYKDGDFAAPDCWSTNGMKPDIAAPKKQNETCRGCKWDAFGSRTMDDGRKGKACSDNKRVAVVPAADIKNEAFGGPMLLKLPPSSFAGLSELEAQLHMQGYRYDGLIIRLSFDYEAAFPKIIFTPIGVLNDHQAQEIVALQDNETVERILSEELVEVSADPHQPTAESNVVPMQRPEPQPVTAPHVPTATEIKAMAEAHAATAFNPSPPPPATVQTPPPGAAAASAFQSPMVTNAPHVETKAPEVTETPEQQIARLKAELAAATGKPPRKRRTAPVTPAGQPQVIVQPPANSLPAGQPQPFTAHAETGNGAVPETDEEEGDEPADLQSRIDALLKPGSSAT